MALITVYTCNNPSSPSSTSGETALLPASGDTADYTPSSMTWSLQDVSAGDAGRTQSGIMYKQRITQKRKLSLAWNGITAAKAAKILAAFNNEYIKVKYPDAMTGTTVTKTFYVGDRSAPVYMYTSGKKIYENIAFDIIER